MPGVLNEIGFFQFDNLIRNRIPFLILNLGANLTGLYQLPLYQKHLESLAISATLETALAHIKERNLNLHDAILVVCPTGQSSGQVVDALEAQGYSNVFYCKNGLVSLKADASH